MSTFGELEAAIMDRLWRATGPQSVRDVLEDLQKDRTIAYTTVMTVMERLYRKERLTREEHHRAYLYSPVQTRADYTATMMAEALTEATDRTATLVHFAERVTARDAKQLIKALTERTARRS